MKDQINLSDKSKISMPIAYLIMVIALVASTVFGYSALTNRITALETSDTLFEADLLKKAQQPHVENKEIYKKENRTKSRTILVTFSILLVACFFTYNLFVLFLGEMLKEVPFVREILSQISFYATGVNKALTVIVETIMNFIPSLV